MNFNPIDKIPVLMETFKSYNPILRSRYDGGYDWLENDAFCVEIPNPSNSDSIIIECGNTTEFTLCFSYYHSHFFADDNEYNDMCKEISKILNNKSCSATIFCGKDNKWLGSTLIEKEKISLPIKEIFSFIFERNEQAEKLRINGGQARFYFWDKNLSKIIKL